MLRYRGLTYRELLMNLSTDGARRHLAPGEQFENAPSHGVPQYVERMHTSKLKPWLI